MPLAIAAVLPAAAASFLGPLLLAGPAVLVNAVTRRRGRRGAGRSDDEAGTGHSDATAEEESGARRSTANSNADGLTGAYWQPDLSSPTAIRAQRRAHQRRALAAAADSSAWAEADGFAFDDEELESGGETGEEEIPQPEIPESAEECESASIAPLASTSASEDADDLAPPAPVQLDLAPPSVQTSDASSSGIAASADALLPASASASASEEEKQDDEDDDDDDEEESPKMASVEESGQFPQSKTPRPADDEDDTAGIELVTASALASASAGGMTGSTTTADESVQVPSGAISSSAAFGTLSAEEQDDAKSAEATAVETLTPTAVKSVKPTLKISIPGTNADSGSGGVTDVAASSVLPKDDGGDDEDDSSYDSSSTDAKPAATSKVVATAKKEGEGDEDDANDDVDGSSVGSITSVGTGAAPTNASGMMVDTSTTTNTISGTNIGVSVNGSNVNGDGATNVNGTTDASPVLLAHVLETNLHLNDEGPPPPSANGMEGIIEAEAEPIIEQQPVIEQPNHPIEAEAEQQPVVLEEDPAPAVVPVPPEAEVQPEVVPVVEEAPVPPMAAPVAEAEAEELNLPNNGPPAEVEVQPEAVVLQFDGPRRVISLEEASNVYRPAFEVLVADALTSGANITVDFSDKTVTAPVLRILEKVLRQAAPVTTQLLFQSILASIVEDEHQHAAWAILSDIYRGAPVEVLDVSSNAIGDTTISFMAPLLQIRSLISINLYNDGLSLVSVDALNSYLLPIAPKIQRLNIGRNKLEGAGSSALAPLLVNATGIVSFEAGAARLRGTGSVITLSALAKMAMSRPDGRTDLTVLDLDCASVRTGTFESPFNPADATPFDPNQAYTFVDPAGTDDDIENDTSANAVPALRHVIQLSPSLERLVLSSTNIGADGVELVLSDLECSGASLTCLNISYIDFDSTDAVQALATHIVEYQAGSLTELLMEGTYIDDEGLATILPVLARCTNLRVLNFSYNCLDEDSFAVLSDPGLRIESLEVLNLIDDENDDIEAEAADIIALYGAGVVQVVRA